MSATRRIHRTALICAIACAALLLPAAGAVAAPELKANARHAALAQERYYASYGEANGRHGALAQEHYYASYGEPQSLTLPQSPAPSDDSPWLEIALIVAAGLVGVAGVAAIRLRRHRVPRHSPRVAA